MGKAQYSLVWVALISLFQGFLPAQAQAPAQCNTVYAVHDEGVSDTQFFTYDLTKGVFNSLGEILKAYDIEAFDIDPQTRHLFAT